MAVLIKQERNPPAEHNIFTCLHCGKESHRRLSGTNKKNGVVNKWCSMECRKGAASIERAHRKEQHQGLVYLKKVARLFLSFPPSEEKKIRRYNCPVCSTAYEADKYLYGNELVCTTCKDVKDKANRAASALRAYEAKKASRVKHKAIRRARMRIEAETVSPTKVFDRDKWTCQLCLEPTPKKMRGKNKPNSPELDHVIPLALGGSHTWANLQCLCRSCNLKKGCRPLGQIGLGFGV